MPRCKRRVQVLRKSPSTAFGQEAEVGVKWNTKRACRWSQARTRLFRVRFRSLAGLHRGQFSAGCTTNTSRFDVG